MADENQQAQNAEDGQPSVPAQPQGGEQKTGQEQGKAFGTETPPQAPTETQDGKEAKKDKDFEAGMHKYKGEAKTWKQEAEKLQSELDSLKGGSPQAPKVEVETPAGEGDDAEAKARAEIGNILEEKLAPIKTQLEKVERKEVIDEIGNKPYTGHFAEEIAEEAKRMPAEIPFGQRLRQAYATVISNNIETIAKLSREAGTNDAYDHQTVKGQPVIGAQPSSAGQEPSKSLLERYKAGELSSDELVKHRVELDKARKAELGIE